MNNYKLQKSTIWNFPERGSWATHNGSYRGNWSPHIPRNIILRYSKPGDTILDMFVGGGTTLVEAKILGRNGVGVDINPKAIEKTLKNLEFECEIESNQQLYLADSRNLEMILDNSFDLICTHPPYANIVKYSDSIIGDLSHLDVSDFLDELPRICSEAYRVLRIGKICAVMMGDCRKNSKVLPLGFFTMQAFLQSGFKLREIIIKNQNNCSSTKLWEKRIEQLNILLISHEYLFIFEK